MQVARWCEAVETGWWKPWARAIGRSRGGVWKLWARVWPVFKGAPPRAGPWAHTGRLVGRLDSTARLVGDLAACRVRWWWSGHHISERESRLDLFSDSLARFVGGGKKGNREGRIWRRQVWLVSGGAR